jgi:hypothetical protein
MPRYIDYFCGLDLGQAQDYTALAVIQVPIYLAEPWVEPLNLPSWGWTAGERLTAWQRAEVDKLAHRDEDRPWYQPGPAPLWLRHVQRFPLGTPYPVIAWECEQLLQRPPLWDAHALIVDATGVGAPVVDLLRDAGLSPVAVSIHGGDAVTRGAHGWGVPKRDLVAAVQVLLETQRLKISAQALEAETLTQELMGFQRRVTKAGHDSYGQWREGAHDDLVLATALAAWWAMRALGSRELARLTAGERV